MIHLQQGDNGNEPIHFQMPIISPICHKKMYPTIGPGRASFTPWILKLRHVKYQQFMLLLFLLIHLVQATKEQCIANYKDTKVEPGMYYAHTGGKDPNTCYKGYCRFYCGPGTFSVGQCNQECTSCPPGQFTPNTGSTECNNCPAGTFSLSGSVTLN